MGQVSGTLLSAPHFLGRVWGFRVRPAGSAGRGLLFMLWASLEGGGIPGKLGLKGRNQGSLSRGFSVWERRLSPLGPGCRGLTTGQSQAVPSSAPLRSPLDTAEVAQAQGGT